MVGQELFNDTVIRAIRRNNPQEVEKFIVNINEANDVGWRLLHYAAKLGSLEVAEHLVNRTADINAKSDEGNKPLHIAADHGHKRIVEFFINEGMDINDPGKDKWRPIHFAANRGHLGLVKFLGEKEDIEIDAETKDGWTPLHFAANEGRLSIIKFLIGKEANINAKNSDNKIPLELASENDHQEAVKLLRNEALLDAVEKENLDEVKRYLEDGADVNYSDSNRWTPLHYAAQSNLACVKLLVEQKAKINAKNCDKNKPLHIAAENGYEDIVLFFLDEQRLSVNDQGHNNWTPLHYAANGTYLELGKALVKKEGVKINARDKVKHQTPLHYAASRGDKEFVRFLIGEGANVDAKNDDNKTPLQLTKDMEVKKLLLGKALIDAVRQNDISNVKEYIRDGADLNYSDEKNKMWTPLHYAASKGYQRSAEALIGKDQDVVNAQDSDHNKPLHIAAQYGRKNIIKLLLKREGLNINDQNKDGWSPLHYAADKNHFAAVELLVEEGANINLDSFNSTTPIQLAKENNHKAIVTLLLNRALLNSVNQGDISETKKCLNDGADINYSSSSDGWTPLHHATNRTVDDQEFVRFLVEKGANITAKTNIGDKSLHIASDRGHTNIVKFLIEEKKLGINDRGTKNRTPLHYAADKGHFELAKFLIEKGANITALDISSNTPLHYAAQNGSSGIVEILVKERASISVKNSDGATPLELATKHEIINFLLNEGLLDAIRRNKALEVEWYLNKKANVDYHDQDGWTPLHCAAYHDYYGIAQFLVQNHANVNAIDQNAWTPLHRAAEGGHRDIVEFLIKSQANANARNSDDDNSLHVAASNGHENVISFLLNAKELGIDDFGKDKWTPLHYAAAKGHLAVVKFLISNGASIDIKNSDGKTPLQLAETGDHIEVKRILLSKALFDAVAEKDVEKNIGKIKEYIDHGADVNYLDQDNKWTLLHYAAYYGHQRLAEVLIEKGADIKAENSDGNKPLHIAAGKGYISNGKDHKNHKSIVALFLNEELGVNDQGENGWAPLHCAAKSNHLNVVQYLVEEKKADMNLKDDDDAKPVHVAAEEGHKDIVEFFLNKKLSVNDTGKEGWTLLHYAADKGHSTIVEFLIVKGANIDARNSKGKTPLQLAQDNGHKDVAKLLLDKALFDAVRQGDSDKVRNSFDIGASVNSTDQWGWGVLHVATARNNLPVIRILVEEKGADINAQTKDGDKPLHVAAEKGYLEVIRYFLSRKKSAGEAEVMELINSSGKNDWTPLHYAAKYNHLEVVEFLIENGADVNARSFDGKTPLQLTTGERIIKLLKNKALSRAVKLGNNDDVTQYLNDRANVNYSERNNRTVLHEASSEGHLRIVRTLITSGADVNAQDFDGNKPLHIAATSGHRDIVEFFLQEPRTGLSINDQGKNNWTPLHYVASEDRLAVAEFLIAKGADINIRDFDKNKPLHIAANNGKRGIIGLFLRENRKGFSINDKGKNDWTALHYASNKGYPGIVKLLIEKGADINAQSSSGKIPLQLASNQEVKKLLRNKALLYSVKQGNYNDVQKYLSDGADPNYSDQNNWTPMHDAASKGCIEIVKLLEEQGASIYAEFYDAKPLHHAARNGHKDVVEFFIDKGLRVDDIGRNKWTPLHYAARYGHLAVIRLLVEKKADINAIDINKNKPLHIAAQYGHTNVVEFFFKENREGLSIDDKGASNKTALHYAAENGHPIVVELLIEKGADINVLDSEDNTPLKLAVERNEYKVIELLQNKALFDAVKQEDLNKINESLSYGTNVNTTDKRGWGALHVAAENGNLSVVKFLVEDRDAGAYIKNVDGETPLHIAAKNGRTNIVGFFLDHGLSVNDLGKNNWTPLHYAAREGHLELAKFLIRKGAGAYIKNVDGETPLHIAAKNGRTNIVEFFLDHGLSVNDLGKNNWTPLHYAARNGHFELVKFLIRKRADINARSTDDETPLEFAEDKEIIKLLSNELLFYFVGCNDIQGVKDCLSNGADPNYSNYGNRTMLHHTAQEGYLKLAKILIEEGASVNAESNNVKPIHIAAQYGHKDIVKLFLNQGSSIDSLGWNGWTPLHYAAENGKLSVVKFLIEKGADINAKDSSEKIPLQLAAEKGHSEVAQALSNAGLLYSASKKDLRKVEHYFHISADVNARDSNGFTPLHKAALSGNVKVVRFLLNKDADIHAKDKEHYFTSLHEAAKGGSLEVVKLLVDHGADVHGQARDEEKPLHIAAQCGHKDIVEFFLSKGLSIDEVSKNGRTALHYSAQGGKLEMTRILVNKGANINVEDSSNVKPLHVAVEYGHRSITEFFIVEKQLGVTYQDKHNRTLMHYAATSGNLPVIELLVNKGVSASASDVNDVNPLHIAARYGHESAVKFFLDKGLNVNLPDKSNRTALHYATRGGSLEIIKLLSNRGANVNMRDSNNAKPLHIAAQSGYKDIVEFFIVQKELDVNDLGKDNWTPLYYAAKGYVDINENKLLEVIKFLFRQDSSIIDGKDFYGANPLHVAAKHGHESIVEFFVQKELNVNSTDSHRLTPLHYAAGYGHLGVVKLLVEEKADIGAISSHGKKPMHSAAKNAHKNIVLFLVHEGRRQQIFSDPVNDRDTNLSWTPLHYAAHSGNLDFVRLLLANGANIIASDDRNAKPLHIAAERGYPEIIELLLNQDQKMDVNDRGKDQWTPLHYSARHGKLKTIKFLVEKRKADAHATDSRGRKPLHVAAEHGYKDVVRFFLDKGLSVNDSDISDWTPLHYAASHGYLETVKFLIERGADINLLTNKQENPLNVAIAANHQRVAEYLTQVQERKGRRNERSIVDQLQSSGANKQSSLVSSGITWARDWISELFSQSTQVTQQSSFSNDLPPLSKSDDHQTATSIIQNKLDNINSGDVMLYYILYSWFHGNKCKIIPKICESSTLQEKDIVSCTLNIGEKCEITLKHAARSSGISWKSVKFDCLEVQRVVTAKITSGDYDIIPELLDSYTQKALPQSLNQKQVDNFKKAYDREKNKILNNELYKEILHGNYNLQGESGQDRTNMPELQVNTYIENAFIESVGKQREISAKR